MMLRNKYLQAYKTSVTSKANVQQLLCHFSYVYATMGSILQDIQYTIGSIFQTFKVQQRQLNPTKVRSPTNKNRKTQQIQIDLLSQIAKVQEDHTKRIQNIETQLKRPWQQKTRNMDIERHSNNSPSFSDNKQPQNSKSRGNPSPADINTLAFDDLFNQRSKNMKPQKVSLGNKNQSYKKSNQSKKLFEATQNQQQFMDQLFEKKKRNFK